MIRTTCRASILLILALCFGATASSCEVYPILILADTVRDQPVGSEVFLANDGRGMGIASWSGRLEANTIATSLQVPGDAETYVNPDEPADLRIAVGKWVAAGPWQSNAKAVRDRLDALMGREITALAWDESRGIGAREQHHISALIRITLVAHDGRGGFTVRFDGNATCGDGGRVHLRDYEFPPLTEAQKYAIELANQPNDRGEYSYFVHLEERGSSDEQVERIDQLVRTGQLERKGWRRFDPNDPVTMQYEAELRAAQTEVLAATSSMLGRDLRVVAQHVVVGNMISMWLTPEEANAVSGISGVKRVEREPVSIL